MMDVRYKRDLNSNYMIMTDAEKREEIYEDRMITENRIYGFLPCVEQKKEKQTEYFYEITGRQSMELLYERRKVSYEQLVELLKDFLQILNASEEYLLNADHFVLLPEYLYLDTRTERLYVCYYPGYEKKIRESFLDLAEYLMGKLDKSDRKGIEFGYDLYQCALEPNFSLMEILKSHTEPEFDKLEEKAQPLNNSEIRSDPLPTESAALQISTSVKKSVQEEILEKTGSWKNFFHKKKKQPMETYVAEADQIKSGSVLFLREQGTAGETTFLREEKRYGLLLKSKNPDYPDLKMEGTSFLIGKRKESVDGWVPAPTVSRIHARIIKEEGCYLLEDLNSTNGTRAGQHQLNPYELFPLDNGMRVAFAGAEYEALL